MGTVWGDSGSGDSREAYPNLAARSTPGELWNPDFMREYTDFESCDEFLLQSPWDVLSVAELEQVPENPRDAYVDQHTAFAGIDEMEWVANTEWVSDTFSH